MFNAFPRLVCLSATLFLLTSSALAHTKSHAAVTSQVTSTTRPIDCRGDESGTESVVILLMWP